MASQNHDPAAASVAATHKGAKPSGVAAWGPLGKRLWQRLTTFMKSGHKGISAFPKSDHLFQIDGDHPGSSCVGTQGNICLDILKDNPAVHPEPARRTQHLIAFSSKKCLQEIYLKQVRQEP
ncbi:unnamed protein product [Nyctereutes procyonoides]|uniref:(raccoon dog) hypothetical protein n=1 Tax=Nyctereutes procyonoides TaxID=34880 RepID=A0A811YRR6_NYCPR|nr:unnamed protein product [Nyctereutes procyonoides]CAD7688250.1 unnamed protein product [Nyctereutes procyonoides]